MTPHKENHLKKALFATDGVSAIHVPGTARWYWAEANDTMDHRRVVKVWRATGPSEDSVIWRFYGLDVTDLVGTAHYPHSMESHPTIRHLRKIAVLIGTRYTDYTLTSDLLRLVTTHGIVQCMDLADVPIVAVTYQYWDVRQQALRRLAGFKETRQTPSESVHHLQGPQRPFRARPIWTFRPRSEGKLEVGWVAD